MKLSIIVPAYNEEKLLGATLASIQAAAETLHQAGWETERIVCDNNSKDRTADLARAAGARVVFEPVNQISRARNTGAAAATGDWLLFIDADSQPSVALFRELASVIEAGACLGGGCTVALDAHAPGVAFRLLTGLWNRLSRIMKWAAGSFVFCEAAAFRELGGFSLELYASEEIEFSRRLKRLARRRGRRVVILSRHPLLTSARKVGLYSVGEYARFFARTILGFGATLKAREGCPIWYDGRR
jgi:glycosyltransferase involved in cell wall biosynthesis